VGEGEARDELQPAAPRARRGIVVLRLISAALVVLAGTALTLDLADKASRKAPATPAPPEETAAPEEERHRAPRYVLSAAEPTVYDSQADLEECAASRHSFGSPSDAPGLDDDIRAISERVERIRKLRFVGDVDTRLVPRAEVGARFVRGFERQYTAVEAAQDERVLVELGLIPEGVDLRELGTRFLTEGVAGFYSPWRKRLFAAATNGELTPFDEVVLAHELDHALTDQVLGLPGTISRDALLADVMLAHLALVEGDATLAMSRYGAARLEPEALDAFLGRFSGRVVSARPDIPYVLLRSSEFPYYEGLLFACAAWSRAEWSAVDAMYARPPASTAEIVFPGRYHAAPGVRLPPSPRALSGRWEEIGSQSLGVFDLMLLLENADMVASGQTVPGSHADEVRGWDGGVLRAWERGSDTAVHVALVDAGVETDAGRRKRRLCGVLAGWFEKTFPAAAPLERDIAGAEMWLNGDTFTGLRCRGRLVAMAIGPSVAVVERLLRR
jgi:hypothetical protein